VYLDNTGYWGLISTVLNFEALYSVIHNRAQQLGIKIAILDLASDADKQKVLFGDNDLLLNYNYSINLNIPGRDWLMVSAPAVEQGSGQLQSLRFGGWAMALLLSFLLYTFLRSLARQNLTLHALDESQQRFSQAFNTSPQGMALITNKGEWLDFNDSLCATLNYSREQLQDLSFYKIIAPEQQARVSKIIATDESRHLPGINFSGIPSLNPQPFGSQSASNQYDCILLNSAGRYVDVILSLAPIQTTKNSNTKNSNTKNNNNWIVQIIDISHRVAIEKLLQEEAHYNQAILNSVVDSIITINKRGIICSANPATQTIFKCSQAQLLHKHINYFLEEPHASNIMAQIKSHTKQSIVNAEINHDIVGLRMDGSSFSLELQLSCINRGDEEIFIAVIRDISERKRLDRMKNDFISVISHELRTPLTAILGSLRLLEGGALGQFSEQPQKMIRIAHENGKKLSLLIDDLLDMDKLLAGKMQFDLKVQPVYPLIVQALENNSTYAQQYQVELELITTDDFLKVNVDGHRFQQVLSNLLSNAAKFSPANSKVVIQILNTGSNIRIEIKDQGVGISQAAQKKLFEKFYQVDSSNTRQKGGTGLGLAISKELMEAMHGSIGVISEEGKGSCFYIELPLIK
jgi:PAS domain S-box-containing protein